MSLVVVFRDKAGAMDRALESVTAGELQHGDMAVLWCLCSGVDRQTGECRLRYQTIAGKCGVSRSTAVRAIARLKSAGFIAIRPNFYKETGGKTATTFLLCEPRTERVTENRPSKRQPGSTFSSRGRCTSEPRVGAPVNHLNVSQGEHSPMERPAQKNTEPIDWAEIEGWLIKQGRYQSAGWGYQTLAADQLAQMRAKIGDSALAAAIERAKALRLYGNPLIDFLLSTRPRKQKRAS